MTNPNASTVRAAAAAFAAADVAAEIADMAAGGVGVSFAAFATAGTPAAAGIPLNWDGPTARMLNPSGTV